jgi:hypothetical protein
VKLVDHAVHPSEFEETTEGFSVSVMHQVHCVVSMSELFGGQFNLPICRRSSNVQLSNTVKTV